MGQSSSKSNHGEGEDRVDGKRHGKPKHEKKLPKTQKEHYGALPFSAKEWSLLFDDTPDKFKKISGKHGFQAFKTCRRKPEKQHDSRNIVQWNTSYCDDVIHEKQTANFIFQLHGQSHKVAASYHSNVVLDKILRDSELVKVVPSSENYLSLFFKEVSLDSVTHHLVLIADITYSSFMYFFIEKPPPTRYDLEQLQLSPDKDRACVLLSSRYMDATSYQIQVYSRRPDAFASDFQGCTFELEYEIPGILPCFGCPKMIFDPRFYTSHLGILNIQAIQGYRLADYFTVYDLQKKRTATSTAPESGEVLRYELLDGNFSLDGSWVYALAVRPRQLEADTGNTSTIPSGKITRYIMVFNSDTALLMQILDVGIDNVGECFLNFAPSFSRCGRKVALRSRRHVRVFQLPRERTLKAMCRAVLRAKYDQSTMERMEAPVAIRRYINMLPGV